VASLRWEWYERGVCRWGPRPWGGVGTKRRGVVVELGVNCGGGSGVRAFLPHASMKRDSSWVGVVDWR